MNRSPSWSDQLHAVLSSTDENMARIKQSLYPFRVSSTDRPCSCPFPIPTIGDLADTWTSHRLPPQPEAQAQQPWALKTPTLGERLSCTEAHSSSLWDEVTKLRSQLQAQAQVTEALKHSVQSLLKDREQHMFKISALEASLKLLQEGPKGRALLEQCLEGLKKELQGLRSQVQELVQNQMKARPGKLGPASGFHQELQSENSVPAQQSKLPLARAFTMSLSSSSSEVSLPDCGRSWELLKKLDRELQNNSLPNLEPSSSQFHAWSLGQEDLFLEGPTIFQSDL
ncbi:transmembrane protein CCDC163 isoform X6 [Mus musculus]|uniref:transmembrane protein CCDC163 isoform X6 n=1 Tax=Mus musculus TaxID=10090 RepID=UPI0003D6F315|nr:transmembrane protein CCDC163 isoform X6 [Mus musculus]|eukprot:XP_006503426.1 PREDICTED: coiled-coil domain containing 163 isoform X6 [Mus musculus]